MKFRLPVSFYDLKDSLWYRPAIMTLAAVILSLITVQLDNYLFGTRRVELPWLFEGGSEGARGVLSAIASTMITVATTAFSVTLVALQLGSSQFSPRILRSFTGDTGNQTVLGIFIATFAYSLSVLRTVRSRTEDYEGFVPTISVTVALILAFASVGSLIFFFHHATRTIQASVVIDRTYKDTDGLVERQHRWMTTDGHRLLHEPLAFADRFTRVEEVDAERSGYIQDSNAGQLVKIGARHNVLIQLHPQIGDYLNPGARLATVWRENDAGVPEVEESLTDAIRSSFELGLERTLELDALFGMQQLTDIALLALSPGTNDPTTALSTIDRIGTAVMHTEIISGTEVACADSDGTVRVLHPVPKFADYVRMPFDQIRHYGVSDPTVTTHTLRTLGAIATQLRPENAAIVKDVAAELEIAAQKQDWVASDFARVEESARWVHESDHSPSEPLFTGRP